MSLNELMKDAREKLVNAKADVEAGKDGAVDVMTAAMEEVKGIQSRIDAVNESQNLLKSLGSAVVTDGPAVETAHAAKSIGEHFVKFREEHPSAENRVIATAFKAAGDPTVSTGLVATEFDREPVRRVAAPLTVLDLFARKSVTNPVYSWNVYSSTTGSVGTTSEGATKNKLTYAYAPKTATLQKITGLIKVTEELFADAPYIVDAINQDLVDDLNANRQTQAVTTLLGTSGIQTASVTYASAVDIADGIIDAMATVEDSTNIPADAVLVTPAVWKILAKAKNTLNEYIKYEPLNNIAIIKSADVTANHVIVGAFARGAELVSKADGVRVDSTNSNDVDFEKNLVSIRAEAREILAVKRPACFVNITLTVSQS